MKTIQEPIETVIKIAGPAHFSAEKKYRRSSFCVEVPCGDGLLLYQTLTGELLLLDGERERQWETSDDLRGFFVSHRFLVPEGLDEIKLCDQVRTVARLAHRAEKRIHHYVIFTTTDCNARCYYCFEKGQRRISMTAKTAEDTAEYMLKHSQGGKITIRWFGGEPLFNSKAIDIISEKLTAAGVDFSAHMVTNAYLFDSETVKKAMDLWRLKSAVVTVDGTEESYNRTKAFIYRDQGSAYRRVLGNIDRLLDAGCSVTVNMNLDARNAKMQFDLADEFIERFGGRKNFKARPGLLIEYDACRINRFESKAQALETLEALSDKLAVAGIKEKRMIPGVLTLNSCMADDPGTAVIQPDGHLTRCEHFGEGETVGSIYDAEWDAAAAAKWAELRPAEESCKTCALYPQCLRVKKCNSAPDPCTDLFRGQRLLILKYKMLNTYEKQKNGSSEKTGEE